MNSSEAFEDSLKLSKISLFLSGVDIYSKKSSPFITFVLSSIFYLNFLWLYTDVIGEFYWLIEGIQIGKSFSELTVIAPCATICLLATAKSTPLYYNRNLLLKIVNKLRKIHPDFKKDVEKDGYDEAKETLEENGGMNRVISNNVLINNNDDKENIFNENLMAKEAKSKKIEIKIVEDSTKFLNAFVTLLSFSCAVVVSLFSFLPIVSMGYDYYTTGETELKFPFLIKYFFDPFTKTRWPFVYIHQVWSTFIACFNVFGADTFHYAFCSYVQMHFKILCHRFENMVSWSQIQTRKRLVKLVKRHQELIELVDQMEFLYSKSTLFNIITSSVLICLSGFNVVFVDDTAIVFAFLSFLIMSFAQISLLCLFGDMLMRSSTGVSEAIYKCRWYDTDEWTKKNILIVITRAQKPCKLTAANFANLNLTAFTTILSRSWSYFALLKTMFK